MRPSLFLAALSSLLLVACAQTSEVAKDPATDPSCTAYFDGCNTCTKMQNGTVTACTKKFCSPEVMQEPKCLEYRK